MRKPNDKDIYMIIISGEINWTMTSNTLFDLLGFMEDNDACSRFPKDTLIFSVAKNVTATQRKKFTNFINDSDELIKYHNIFQKEVLVELLLC